MGLHGILTALGMNALGVVGLVLAFGAFLGILVWTFTRPADQIEAASRLWMDEEN
jgi:hypothetical protein